MRNLFVCVDQTNCFSFPLLFLCDRSEFGLILAYFYLCDRTDFFASSNKVDDFIRIFLFCVSFLTEHYFVILWLESQFSKQILLHISFVSEAIASFNIHHDDKSPCEIRKIQERMKHFSWIKN